MNTRTFLKSVGAFCLWPFVPKKKILAFPAPKINPIDQEYIISFTIKGVENFDEKKWIKMNMSNHPVNKEVISEWNKEQKPHTLLSYKRIDKDGNII